jgi:hypothetical protein
MMDLADQTDAIAAQLHDYLAPHPADWPRDLDDRAGGCWGCRAIARRLVSKGVTFTPVPHEPRMVD